MKFLTANFSQTTVAYLCGNVKQNNVHVAVKIQGQSQKQYYCNYVL